MGWLDAFLAEGSGFGLLSAVEIFLLAYLIYQLLLGIRGTRASPVAVGVAVVGGIYLLAGMLGFKTIHWSLGSLTPYWPIVLIVLFQNELRRALAGIPLQFLPRTGKRKQHGTIYEDVIYAVQQLSQDRVGALIVIERETGLRTFVQSGVAMDASLSADLLVSIFQRSTPLHDGAVILAHGRVAAAACFLPLTTNPGLVSTLGTRHRAAIGITEDSDCVAIVVSEVNGKISVAGSGDIERGLSLDGLRLLLIERLGPVVNAPSGADVVLPATDAPASPSGKASILTAPDVKAS